MIILRLKTLFNLALGAAMAVALVMISGVVLLFSLVTGFLLLSFSVLTRKQPRTSREDFIDLAKQDYQSVPN